MKIYVDFDDVVAETARGLAQLLERDTGRRVEYEDIFAFDLRESFKLDQGEYIAFMEKAHQDEALMAYEETTGACAAMAEWIRNGIEPVIVTGRPASTSAASRDWLARRGLPDIRLMHVDKYHRNLMPASNGVRTYTFDDLAEEHFDYAIDDSPTALDILSSSGICPYIIFDRPWNRSYAPPRIAPVFRAATWPALTAFLSR